MSERVIAVENLSKRYRIGHRLSAKRAYHYTALRDVLERKISNFARKAADVIRGRQVVHGDEVEEFWSLKDVSFEVNRGDILGIIGRNGAGKSTLLKILSRITEPTAGRIRLSGRVGSLLEVGTGFHPELTGRENIFLNGAILGMRQREIRRKFDEIVAFAEVEKFLDTPVKHYSSGMYVRLAFAVAAHLEPEILIVDEVLAVGDAEFQRKCLGKMGEVSREQGRTVLFVTHNMEAALRLCTRCILLESGRIRAAGNAKEIVPTYLQTQSYSPTVVDLSSVSRAEHFAANVRLVRASPSDPTKGWVIPFGEPLSLDLAIDAEASVSRVDVIVAIFTVQGFQLTSWTNKCSDAQLQVKAGTNIIRLGFQHLRLLPGRYSLGIGIRDDQGSPDWIPEAVMFEIVSSAEAAAINADVFTGAFVPYATVSVIS